MPRAFIRRGELHHGYEPHDLPGAWVKTRFAVMDPTGEVDSAQIAWDGPCIWMAGRDGVPDGWRPLWLGEAHATRPIVVYVSADVTPATLAYDAAYRRGFLARRVPKPRDGEDSEGLYDGWRDGRMVRAKK